MAQNFLFRVNQYSMLGTLPMELVAEFWRKHPFFIDGRQLSTREALEQVFRRGSTPTSCFIDMCSHIERFYCDHGQDFREFRRTLSGFSSRQSGFHQEQDRKWLRSTGSEWSEAYRRGFSGRFWKSMPPRAEPSSSTGSS